MDDTGDQKMHVFEKNLYSKVFCVVTRGRTTKMFVFEELTSYCYGT